MTAAPPYEYRERVLLEPLSSAGDGSRAGSGSDWLVRLETEGVLDPLTAAVHPLSPLVAGLLSGEVVGGARRLTIQTGASSASSSAASGGDLPSVGPSGFYVAAWGHGFDFRRLLDELVERRLVAAPVGNAHHTRRRAVGEEMGITSSPRTREEGCHVYELHLPTTGAAWSADALHQTLSAWNPKSGGGVWGITANATALSHVLLSSRIPARRSMWLDLSIVPSSTDSSTTLWKISQGIHFPVHNVDGLPPKYWQKWALPGVTKIIPSPFATSPVEARVVVRDEINRAEHLVSIEEWSNSHLPPDRPPAPIASLFKSARRPLGPANGGTLEILWINHHESCSARIALRDTLPTHLVSPKWHTFRIEGSSSESLSYHIDFEGADNERVGTHLSLQATVPPNQSLRIALDYDPKFLGFQQFPGDPNRGREIAPAFARARFADCHIDYGNVVLYSNSFLILPPVPDMSMPFNVISISCSLYAYVFGALLAIIVRKGTERTAEKYKGKTKDKKQTIKERILNKVRTLLRREKPSTNHNAEGKGTAAKQDEKEATKLD